MGYYVLNLGAASLVLISLSVDYNLSSIMIQVFWITISMLGIATVLLRRSHRA